VINLLTAIAIFITGLLAGIYWQGSYDPSVSSAPAMVTPEVAKIEKEEIKPAKLKVYKQEAKDKLPLPEKIKDDKDEHVISASQIKGDGQDHTVITVVNAATGEATTIDHKKPLPWLAQEKKSEFRLDYGLKGYIAPTPVGRLSFRSELVRVKGLVLGLNTSLDFDGEYFLGGGVGYRW
jgi:hypothetical protein